MRNAEDTPADGFTRVAGVPGASGTPEVPVTPGHAPLPRRRPGANRPDWTAPGEAEALASAEALRYAAQARGAPWGPAPQPPRPAEPGSGGPRPAPARSAEPAPRGRGPRPAPARSAKRRPAAGDHAPPRPVRANWRPAARDSGLPHRPPWRSPAGPRPAARYPRPRAGVRRRCWPRSPTWWCWPARQVALCGPGAGHTTWATAPGWSAGHCSPPPSPGWSCRRARQDCSPAGGGSLTCWHLAHSVPGCWCLHSCCRRLDRGGHPPGRRTSQAADGLASR